MRIRLDAVSRFSNAASSLGLQIDPQRFPDGTRTAEDAARAVGCDLGQIVKSLVFVAGSNPVIILTSGTNRVDTAAVGRILKSEQIRRADANEARAATGYAVGGTPPFGYPAPLMVLMDRDLLLHSRVWAAAGTPDTVFEIDPSELLKASGAQVADIKE
ncbi:MAG TPA: YbaK/EbsC family protein [Actinomycetota bacterium]|nr:YbaK/EbsC family protein [Actinomycetota bacterium]